MVGAAGSAWNSRLVRSHARLYSSQRWWTVSLYTFLHQPVGKPRHVDPAENSEEGSATSRVKCSSAENSMNVILDSLRKQKTAG